MADEWRGEAMSGQAWNSIGLARSVKKGGSEMLSTPLPDQPIGYIFGNYA
jgi:hypothetical protein